NPKFGKVEYFCENRLTACRGVLPVVGQRLILLEHTRAACVTSITQVPVDMDCEFPRQLMP
ncbi:hypothetical protein, partial [Bradyrhizobium diazoefficiens]|uniref:hypothetical protein n=1 Tax=Bradyrhizobium diazoefficiens TaxID=1355477 RepID=UPI001AED421B